MKVLVTHSYFYKLDYKQWRFKQPYPPLGTILAAAVLRQAGHQIIFFDTNLEDGPSAIDTIVKREQPDVVVIYDDGFNYLTKMCLTVMREAAFHIIEVSKMQGCAVIVSSSDAADHHAKYFDKGVDFVVKGEGEITLLQLVQNIDNRSSDIIEGVVYPGEVNFKPRTVLKDLDTLPLPAWDLVDVEAYRKIWNETHGYFSLNIATTRGCPFKCNWCAKPIYGNRYTSRSPKHVLTEMEFLIKQYSPDHFWMSDDIFGLKPGWVAQFNQIVKEKHLQFRYKIQSRVDLLLDNETLDALSESGAETVWVGAESGSQKILDAMDKGTTISQIHEATRKLKIRGIAVGFFLQFGYLGEEREDIDATLKMVLELMPDEIGISVSYPLPGTVFYEKVKNQLELKQNWADSDDLAAMFKTTYSNSFYKELHRYVHTEYRKRKGYRAIKKLFSDPFRLTKRDVRSGIATFYYLLDSLVKRLRLANLEHASKN
ncbi:MAG: radical SAM protein [Chryseolinea sp.]